MRTFSNKCPNPNHPKKGSTIKVEPIRDKKSIQKLKDLLADKPRDYCLFTLGINTAYRANELVSIKVGQVAHLKVGDRLDVKQSKNGKYRSVTVNNNAVSAIQACLAIHPSPTPDAPLFFSYTTGRALQSNTVSKYMKGWCNQIGIFGNFASHTMRKTWGYHIYRNNHLITPSLTQTNIAELMIAYGHATERQTLEYLCIQDHDISSLYLGMEL
ncbi:MAG: tyrosine-type recombinase/integrase [Candidatus Thiodiazotropha sp. (ex Lucinoma kastoroae)]|nr:tyrosine-type recombinase/integrase [Candidatus Thiodiazotropha sp. (ex Lucinoma kastoroae)]